MLTDLLGRKLETERVGVGAGGRTRGDEGDFGTWHLLKPNECDRTWSGDDTTA